jgi:hypothetical protein
VALRSGPGWWQGLQQFKEQHAQRRDVGAAPRDLVVIGELLRYEQGPAVPSQHDVGLHEATQLQPEAVQVAERGGQDGPYARDVLQRQR